MKKTSLIILGTMFFTLAFTTANATNLVGVDSSDPRVKAVILKRAAATYAAVKKGKENAEKKNKGRWGAVQKKKEKQLRNLKIQRKLFLDRNIKKQKKKKKVKKKK